MIETTIIKVKKNALDAGDLDICRQVLKNGGVIVFPTDTVYGLGCSAFNVDAVRRIYELKGRSYSKALPILLGEISQLELVVEDVLPSARKLIRRYWPGPLTLVFKTGPHAVAASRGKNTLAVRVPDHGVVKNILDILHVPMAATSANPSGKDSFKTGQEAIKFFNGKVDVIVDGGRCRGGLESTVVDATHDPFTVLREAAISKSDLLNILGQ